ncbi:3-beta hydroxysteroid dehydrogenase [Platysternon megacephalum]|uniref:3-beta hydroxysteroid dehydrogenase n=1 Tax=Platysternon megacephalum TaxID=55544 RepID=A0A4D9DE22_9SAUR|nr:3-beta hydroxysteroid dehydrogenase [Platysternon megacephalum]
MTQGMSRGTSRQSGHAWMLVLQSTPLDVLSNFASVQLPDRGCHFTVAADWIEAEALSRADFVHVTLGSDDHWNIRASMSSEELLLEIRMRYCGNTLKGNNLRGREAHRPG